MVKYDHLNWESAKIFLITGDFDDEHWNAVYAGKLGESAFLRKAKNESEVWRRGQKIWWKGKLKGEE